MKKNKLKILFIGAGNIAKQHLIVLDKLIDLKNSWIYSRTNSKSKKLDQTAISVVKVNEDGWLVYVGKDGDVITNKHVK